MDFRNVKSLMIGGRPVARLLIGGQQVWRKPEPVPVNAYIQTDGQSYMDLGLVPDVLTSYEIDLMFVGGAYTGTSSVRNCAYGCATSTAATTASHVLYFRLREGNMRFAKPTSNAFTEFVPGMREVVRTEPGVTGGTVVTVGGHSESVTAAYTATTTMKFGCSYTGDAEFFSTSRFYAAKFWQNGVLIRDLVPYSGPRGVGLLDKVNDVLYANAGSGSLTYGEE